MATGTIKTNGAVEFDLSTTISNFSGTGVYDRASGTVRIYLRGSSGSDISASATLFTVPTEYRPSVPKRGAMLIVTSSGHTSSAFSIGTDGAILQSATNSLRMLIGMAEYSL